MTGKRLIPLMLCFGLMVSGCSDGDSGQPLTNHHVSL